MTSKKNPTTLHIATFISIIYLSYNIEIIHAQTSFDTTTDGQYQNGAINCGGSSSCTVRCDKTSACQSASINCKPTESCSITCAATDETWSNGGDFDSCNGATIKCPTDSSKSCSVTCTTSWNDARTCNDLNIEWNLNGGSNTLQCDKSCTNVPYPPPVDNVTPFSVVCDTAEECFGTVITCPTNAQCDITCSQTSSCQNAKINCPTDANCNVQCSATNACNGAIINWPPTPGLGSLQCTLGTNECTNVTPPPQPPIGPVDDNTDLTVTCDTVAECASRNITCPTNANCNIICSATNACAAANIQCPTNNGNCMVTCNANSACQNANIKWTDGLQNGLTCGAFDSVCYGVHFQPYDQNTPWTMDCTTADNMCYGATFDCPSNADCTINCNPSSSITGVCSNAIINGPVNKQLTVSCQQSNACEYTHFHAQSTSYFTLDCSITGSYTCTSQSIWFPPKSGAIPNNIIYARDDSFSDGDRAAQYFYAINGWLDVNIQYSGTYGYHAGTNPISTMYCNINYVQSCPFDSNSFSCGSSGDNCDNPTLLNITPAPTLNPTRAPTNQPSSNPTKQPSLNPTTQPTHLPTSNPTRAPTNQPSSNPTSSITNSPTLTTLNPTPAPTSQPTPAPTNIPTISPSKYPTNNPSQLPSKYPTNMPTNIPTISPTNNPSKYPSINPTISPTISTYFPSKYPTISPTISSNSPTRKPTEAVLDLGSPSPTPGPTNNEQGIGDETTNIITTENNNNENNNNQNKKSSNVGLNGNSFTNGPIFFTIVGCIVGLLLFCVVFCIYFIIKKRAEKINNIKHTFTNYNTTNAERAFSTSNVFSHASDAVTSPSSNNNNKNIEGPRKTSISLQELEDPTDTNPHININSWETNPYDHADHGNYGSYIPQKSSMLNSNNNQNGLKLLQPNSPQPQSMVNGLMMNNINNMAENVNNMINKVTLGGPNMDIAIENEQIEEGPISLQAASPQNKILHFEQQIGSITSVNNVLMDDIVNEMDTPQFPINDSQIEMDDDDDDDNEVLLMVNENHQTFGNDAQIVDTESDEQIIDQIDDEIIIHQTQR